MKVGVKKDMILIFKVILKVIVVLLLVLIFIDDMIN